jgi:prophage regulatory protein
VRDEASEIYLSDVQVSQRYGIGRASVWRWSQQGTLPRPVKLASNTTRWRLSDLIRVEAERQAAA